MPELHGAAAGGVLCGIGSPAELGLPCVPAGRRVATGSAKAYRLPRMLVSTQNTALVLRGAL